MADLQVPVSETDHAQGVPDAPITLVEYGDYQCPHCRIADAVVKRVQRHFGERLRFIYRNFPLPIHPAAEPAAEAAEAAAAQGKFWEMHDLIFEHQKELNPSTLPTLAATLGLDREQIERAIREQQFADRIEADTEGALRCGVHGTPTFFINGKQHTGSFEYDELVAAIETAA